MVSGSDASSSSPVSKAEVTSEELAANHGASVVSARSISKARRNVNYGTHVAGDADPLACTILQNPKLIDRLSPS
jgi:hypothetical protein